MREEPDEVGTLKIDQIEVKSYVGGLVNFLRGKRLDSTIHSLTLVHVCARINP